MPDLTRATLHHVALTVTSFEVSIPWYEKVLGVTYQFEEPHPGGVGKVYANPVGTLIIVLHEHETNQRERFSETRTGLDHVGFSVPTRADLEAWLAHLEALGADHSPIKDRFYGSVITFRDPDNIQLELFAPPG